MTDNKRVTNKQILDKIDALKVGEEGLNLLAIKIVSRMVKLKSMEDWFHHVNKSDTAWNRAYQVLDLSEEVEAKKTTLKKALGRKLAARVLKTWVEDFVDEDTGEVISVDRNELIIDRDHILEEEDIDIIIESEEIWGYGMLYVALSRVKTIEGLKLVNFNENLAKVDKRVEEL